jgi:imidazole glycerol-phosphate synthase subunit HisH
VAIIDYGMGNIRSISGALKFLGVKNIIVSSDPNEILFSDKLILPGVGSFGEAMNNIKSLHLDETIIEAVLEKRKPILGICLGMQLLSTSSNEDGVNNGFGFVNGKVEKFESQNIKIPHVGFNQVKWKGDLTLFSGIASGSDFYFTHSYRLSNAVGINLSTCKYGDEFIAGFETDIIAGVQFHPELSQKNGLRLITNFLEKF